MFVLMECKSRWKFVDIDLIFHHIKGFMSLFPLWFRRSRLCVYVKDLQT